MPRPVPDFRVLQRGLGQRAVGHVVDGEQNQLGVVGFWWKPAGVEQHGPVPDFGKIVLHLEVVDGMVIREDFIQQRSDEGDVPLSVAQVVDEAIVRFFVRDVERLEKRAVGRHDSQIVVEHDERFSQVGDDVQDIIQSD